MHNVKYNFSDKVFLVTGGSRGIGLELTRELLKSDARVAICGRKEEGLKKAAEELDNNSNLLTVQAHIAKEEDVNKLFDTVTESFGRLDVLINNVGMNLFTPSLAETEPASWQKIIDSNLSGNFLTSRKGAQIMKEQKSGKIINITSIAGTKASPGMGIYGIAKAGIEMMTKVLASELAFFNIQVNAIAPCMVRTDFSKPFWSNEDILAEIVKGIPMGRIAEIDDIVQPILFFASSGSDFITGQTLMVDGGITVK